jgi:hypothetical protein
MAIKKAPTSRPATLEPFAARQHLFEGLLGSAGSAVDTTLAETDGRFRAVNVSRTTMVRGITPGTVKLV